MFTFRSVKDLDATEGTVTLLDGIDTYPFTSKLNMITAGDILKHKKGSDIVLVPQPSNDLNDPLNWPAWKKATAFVSIGIFSFVGGWTVAGIASGIVLLMNEFHNDLNNTVNGSIEWAI